MGKWKKICRCKKCGKIYPDGVREICKKCGCVIAQKNEMLSLLGVSKCMVITVNCETVIARKHWFRWVLKESEGNNE